MSHWHVDDLCADFRDDCPDKKHHHHGPDCDCGCRKPRRRRQLIPVGGVSVDCTPVTFETPGQARAVLSCPVDEVVNVPVTQTRVVQVPTGFGGCFFCVPITETINVPVQTTVNLPPILTPVPRLVCPTAGFPFTGC